MENSLIKDIPYRKPFTYIVKRKGNKEYYYGSHYSIGCCPNDLGTTYFTSSLKDNCKFEKDFYANPGNFIWRILKIFNNNQYNRKNVGECRDEETSNLYNKIVGKRLYYVNQFASPSKFYIVEHKEETKRKIGKANKGKGGGHLRKGKTNIQIFGEEKAKEISKKLSAFRINKTNIQIHGAEKAKQIGSKISKAGTGRKSNKKGKTNVEIYGEEKAKQMSESMSKSRMGKKQSKKTKILKSEALLNYNKNNPRVENKKVIENIKKGQQKRFKKERELGIVRIPHNKGKKWTKVNGKVRYK